jgi:hypothetical protein
MGALQKEARVNLAWWAASDSHTEDELLATKGKRRKKTFDSDTEGDYAEDVL